MKLRLKDIFDLQMGKTPSRNNPSYWGGENKWVSIADIGKVSKYIEETKENITDAGVAESGIKKVPQNTVIMSFKLSIGKTAITTEEMYTNEAIMAFIDKKVYPLDTNYFYHLCAGKDWSKGTNKAVMGLTLNKATLSEIEIDLPPIDKQKNAASKLDFVDSLITARHEQLAKLNELVKSRFIELFGMVGSDEKDWGLTRLGDCCVVNPKKAADNRLCADLMVSFVPMPAVSEKGEIDASETKTYNEVKTGFTYFVERDVLFAKITPCMENGKGAVARGLCNGIGFGSTEFHVLRPIEGITNPYWIYTVTAFEQFRVAAAANMTGSAGQRRVPASFLENYRIAVPPIEQQEQFAAFVEQTDKSKLAIQESLKKIETLKKALMQKYFG